MKIVIKISEEEASKNQYRMTDFAKECLRDILENLSKKENYIDASVSFEVKRVPCNCESKFSHIGCLHGGCRCKCHPFNQ